MPHLTPYAPMNVFELGDDVLGRLDTSGSELALSIDDDDTELLVATDSGRAPWIDSATFPSHFDFTLRLGGGEVVTVTAIAGTSSPQTFTVTRGTNGVAVSWPAGTRVRLARVAVAL